jgi:hypothetical protein
MSVANNTGFDEYPYPVGGLLMFAGIPSAVSSETFRLCDGSSLSRAEFPELFSVIGTTYGSLSASTFSLPNTVGRYVRGCDATANGVTTPASPGTADIVFSVTEANMPELPDGGGAFGIQWTNPVATIQGNHQYIEYDRPDLEGGNDSGITYTCRRQNGPQMTSVNVSLNSITLSHTGGGAPVNIPLDDVHPANFQMQYFIKVRY